MSFIVFNSWVRMYSMNKCIVQIMFKKRWRKRRKGKKFKDNWKNLFHCTKWLNNPSYTAFVPFVKMVMLHFMLEVTALSLTYFRNSGTITVISCCIHICIFFSSSSSLYICWRSCKHTKYTYKSCSRSIESYRT